MPKSKKASARTKQSSPRHKVIDKRLSELKTENRLLKQKNEDCDR